MLIPGVPAPVFAIINTNVNLGIRIQSEIWRHKNCGKVLKAFNPIFGASLFLLLLPCRPHVPLNNDNKIYRFHVNRGCGWMAIAVVGMNPFAISYLNCSVSDFLWVRVWAQDEFAYKFNNIFSWFYCRQIQELYPANNRRDPPSSLTAHRSAALLTHIRIWWMGGESENLGRWVGAIDLIIILWHNYSIPSARSREFIRILLLLPVEIYLNGGGGGRRRWMTSPPPWCEHYIATYGGGGQGSSSSSSSAPHKGKQTPPLRDSSTEETSWNPSALDPH